MRCDLVRASYEALEFQGKASAGGGTPRGNHGGQTLTYDIGWRYVQAVTGDTSRARDTRFSIKLASHYVPINDVLMLAARVESLGYYGVWLTEGRMAPDAVSVAAAVAARTDRVRIGTSVLNPFSRSPGLLAVTAASLDQLSRGRFVLGIGPGDPAALTKQAIPYRMPLTRLRECVHIVRGLLAGEIVSYDGATISVTDLKLDVGPHNGAVPVYVGATGPRAIEQAIAIGDGVLLNVCVPRAGVEGILDAAHRGVRVIGNVVVGMHEDAEVAIRGTKPLVVDYLTRFPAIAKASGLSESLLEGIFAARKVGMSEACALLPDECVRQLVAVGTPQDCRRWIAEYTAGMDEALLMPSFGDPRMVIDELAELL